MSDPSYYPRFPPKPPSEHPPETKQFAEWTDEKVTPSFGENGSIITYRHPNGGLIGPFPVLIASKEVGQQFGSLLQSFAELGTVPADAKEVAILVVGARFNCAFEQYAHKNIATKKAGLSAEQCDSIRAGKKPEGLSGVAGVTYDAAFHLANEKGPLPGEIYEKWLKVLGGKANLLVMTHYVAAYCYVCVLMNMADTPLPPGES